MFFFSVWISSSTETCLDTNLSSYAISGRYSGTICNVLSHHKCLCLRWHLITRQVSVKAAPALLHENGKIPSPYSFHLSVVHIHYRVFPSCYTTVFYDEVSAQLIDLFSPSDIWPQSSCQHSQKPKHPCTSLTYLPLTKPSWLEHHTPSLGESVTRSN